jgi:tetratricopeptide (TPR) repeat protein
MKQKLFVIILLLVIPSIHAFGEDPAVNNRKSNKQDHLNRIHHLQASDSNEQLLFLIDSLLIIDSGFTEVLLIKANYLLIDNDTSLAESLLMRLIDIKPTSRKAQLHLARIFYKTGRYNEAHERLNFILTIFRRYHPAYIAMGEFYEAQNMIDSAAACYQKAAEILMQDKKLLP